MSEWMTPLVVFWVMGVLLVATVATMQHVSADQPFMVESPEVARAKARRWLVSAPLWPLLLALVWVEMLRARKDATDE